MQKVGILSCGIYIPRYRINRKTISQAVGFLGPYRMEGEKAVANYDEDAISMAVNACFGLSEKEGIEGLFFSSTTSPYVEGDAAALISEALDLPPFIRTANFGSTMKASTSALIFALEAIASQGLKRAIVVASDSRIGKPGSQEELLFGDAAASFVVGKGELLASYEGHFSVSNFFPDYRRLCGEKYLRFVEDRFFREEAYTRFVSEAIKGLFQKYQISSQQITKVGFPCFNKRDYRQLARSLGFSDEQLEEPLLDVIGETGVVSPFLLLISILEKSKPGDRIVIVSYGYGAEALLFKVEEKVEELKSKGLLRRFLNRRKELKEYEKYLSFKGILPRPVEPFGEKPPTRIPLLFRERKAIFALLGSKCRNCGTVQYPPQRVCVNPECGAVDLMEPYRFSEKKGSLYSYTADHIANTPNPPLLFGMIEFEDGARFAFDLTDCEQEMLSLGMEMQMSFRLKFVDHDQGIIGYFWKAIPSF